jgi:hypothetical protein
MKTTLLILALLFLAYLFFEPYLKELKIFKVKRIEYGSQSTLINHHQEELIRTFEDKEMQVRIENLFQNDVEAERIMLDLKYKNDLFWIDFKKKHGNKNFKYNRQTKLFEEVNIK